MLFDHNMNCISVATIDLFLPNLYCYVANQDAHQRQKIKSELQDRRLYLFECTDLLQTRKLIDETKKHFRTAPKKKSSPRASQLIHRVRLDPPTPEKISHQTLPVVPPRHDKNIIKIGSRRAPPPPPPGLPHYLNPM